MSKKVEDIEVSDEMMEALDRLENINLEYRELKKSDLRMLLITIGCALGFFIASASVLKFHVEHNGPEIFSWAILAAGGFGLALIFGVAIKYFYDGYQEEKRIEELAKRSRREEGAYSPHELN